MHDSQRTSGRRCSPAEHLQLQAKGNGLRQLAEAAGCALLLLPNYLQLLRPSNLALYHHQLPVSHLVSGVLIDALALFILIEMFLLSVPHFPQPLQRIVIAMFAGLMLWRMVDIAAATCNDAQIFIAFWNSIRKPACIITSAAFGVFANLSSRKVGSIVRWIRVIPAAFAFSAFWIVPRLLYIALAQQPAMFNPPLDAFPPAHDELHRRVVWILFDELSYDQSFEHVGPDVALPHLSNFRSRSISFSNLQPIGYYTELIIPSLFLGKRIDRVRSTVDGELSYDAGSRHLWKKYDPDMTLFAIAQRRGWNAGIVGWYNPYCRILGPVLNTCFWQPVDIFPTEEYGASEEKSALANAAALPQWYLRRFNRGATAADEHIREYREVMKRALVLIDDTRVRFVFLHLPLPHPPGIYDRRRHKLRSAGTYLDNLVLADDMFGTILRQIDMTSSAKQTTVIVSSDHSWRVPLWRDTAEWTSEEERASGGRFDPRPVLLIHFPGQTSGKEVANSVSELLEYDLVAAMLRDQIVKPEDIIAYLKGHS